MDKERSDSALPVFGRLSQQPAVCLRLRLWMPLTGPDVRLLRAGGSKDDKQLSGLGESY